MTTNIQIFLSNILHMTSFHMTAVLLIQHWVWYMGNLKRSSILVFLTASNTFRVFTKFFLIAHHVKSFMLDDVGLPLFLNGTALVVIINTTTYPATWKKTCFIISQLIKVINAHLKKLKKIQLKKEKMTSNFSFRDNWIVIFIDNSLNLFSMIYPLIYF